MRSQAKINVGFDISQTGPNKAGCGYYAHALIQNLLNISTGFDFSLYPSFGDFYFNKLMPFRNPYTKGKYGPRHLTRDFAGRFWTSNNLEEKLKFPDLIHANNFWCPTKLKSSKLIYTFYDMGFIHNPGWTTETNRFGCYTGVFRASVAADWIVAISESSKQDYLATFPYFPEDRIKVIYPCSRFANADNQGTRPEKLTSVKSGKFWLSVGTIEPRKNQLLLARAYANYLAAGGEKMPLIFAGGNGWLMDDFKDELSKLGILDDIIFTGYVSDDELVWLYRSCYANLYPSLFEGFGLPVLEGMQYGAATLTTNNTSLPEVAGNAAKILRADDLDAWTQTMLTLASSPNERELMQAASCEQASRFSWVQSAEELLSLYEDAHNTPKRNFKEQTKGSPSLLL